MYVALVIKKNTSTIKSCNVIHLNLTTTTTAAITATATTTATTTTTTTTSSTTTTTSSTTTTTSSTTTTTTTTHLGSLQSLSAMPSSFRSFNCISVASLVPSPNPALQYKLASANASAVSNRL